MTDQEWKARFQREPLKPPSGFETRHDALLKRLTAEKEIVMRKKVSFAMALVLILLVLAIGAALAAGMGVFGQFADPDRGTKMQDLDASSQLYDVTVTAEGAQGKYPDILFTLNQGLYDGEALYFSYTLSGAQPAVTFLDGTPEADTKWTFTPQTGQMTTDWAQELSKEDYAQFQKRLETDGRVYFTYWPANIGDGAYLADGTILDVSDSGQKRQEDGTLTGFTEIQRPLPEAARSKTSLDLQVSLARHQITYYQDKTGNYYLYGENIRTMLPFTVMKSGDTSRYEGSASFEAYTANIVLTLTDVQVQADILIGGPEAWLSAWNNNGDGGEPVDLILGYALYADGMPCQETGSALGEKDGNLSIQMAWSKPAAFKELRARPVYNHSGEHPQEEIILTEVPVSR